MELLYAACCLSYTDNTIPADALATLGARASASMVFTPKARIIRVNNNIRFILVLVFQYMH